MTDHYLSTSGNEDPTDFRDNQLDEFASQSLLPTFTPPNMESDSLDGATVDTASPSPNSPNSGSQIMGDGEDTTCNTTSDLNNASSVGTANENGTGLFSKIKSKVGLIKNKEKKVIKQKQTSISNESNNGNEKQISINNGNNISISNDDNLICNNDITQDSSCEGMEEGEVIEYISEGIHAGKSVDEVDFADGSQKRPLSDSSDDTVNSATLLCLWGLLCALPGRKQQSLSLWVNLGVSLLVMSAVVAVRLLGVHCLLGAPLSLLCISYRQGLLLSPNLRGVLRVSVVPKSLELPT